MYCVGGSQLSREPELFSQVETSTIHPGDYTEYTQDYNRIKGREYEGMKDCTETITAELKTKEEADFILGVTGEMVEQFRAKNIAYGDSFGKQFQKYEIHWLTWRVIA